ncbi:MAG TPA: hypothetical protein VI488_06305 [Candidatus Angelobacter sp.]
MILHGLLLQLPNYQITQLPNLLMPDPAEQLQKLYMAGFELQTFDRFPKAIGVLRDGCIVFLVPGPHGLQILGNAGWRMGESLGPLVERDGRKVFVHKDEVLEGTPERIATLERFQADVKAILRGEEATGGE